MKIETIYEENSFEFDKEVNRLIEHGFIPVWETFKFELFEMGYSTIRGFSIIMKKGEGQ